MTAIDELLAKQAITEVLYRYCRGLDRMDRELAGSCWHEDGTADYGDLHRGTGAGFLDWVWPVHAEGFSAHSHQITNVLIEVRGDRAASEAYVTVALRSASPAGAVDVVGRGRYLDRWSRRAGVWAIDHRQHVADLTATSAVVDAGAPGAGRRDPSDPSYDVFASIGP